MTITEVVDNIQTSFVMLKLIHEKALFIPVDNDDINKLPQPLWGVMAKQMAHMTFNVHTHIAIIVINENIIYHPKYGCTLKNYNIVKLV